MADDPQVLEHEYDGIQEFDNPTPGWWHFLFWVFVVFSFFYVMMDFSSSPFLPSDEDRYKDAVLKATMAKFETLGDLEPKALTFASYAQSEEWMSYAASTFASNCASCHGADGGGMVGPNLTDDFGKNIKGRGRRDARVGAAVSPERSDPADVVRRFAAWDESGAFQGSRG